MACPDSQSFDDLRGRNGKPGLGNLRPAAKQRLQSRVLGQFRRLIEWGYWVDGQCLLLLSWRSNMHYHFGVLAFLYKAGALFIGNNADVRRISHRSMANHNAPNTPLHYMELNPNPDNHDIKGKQRIAVYNALQRPVTGRQILASAKQTAPSMSYQDLRHILRDFQQRGIAVCLNPENQTGRIYVLSSTQNDHPIAPEHLDLCARISRAKNRLAVLKELAKERFLESHPLTAN